MSVTTPLEIIGSQTYANNNGAGPHTYAYTSRPGSTLIAGPFQTPTSGTPLPVTDSAGNTWTVLFRGASSTSSSNYVWWYCQDAAAITSFTVNAYLYNNAPPPAYISLPVIYEVGNVSGVSVMANPIDIGVTGAPGNIATYTPGTVYTSTQSLTAGQLLLVGAYDVGSTSATSSANVVLADTSPPAGYIPPTSVETSYPAMTGAWLVNTTSSYELELTTSSSGVSGDIAYAYGLVLTPVSWSVYTPEVWSPLKDSGAALDTGVHTQAGSYTLGNEFVLAESMPVWGVWWYSPSGATERPDAVAVYDVATQTVVAGTLKTGTQYWWSGAAGSGWIFLPCPASVTLAASHPYTVAAHITSTTSSDVGFGGTGWSSTGTDDDIADGPVTMLGTYSATVQPSMAASGSSIAFPSSPVSSLSVPAYSQVLVDVMVGYPLSVSVTDVAAGADSLYVPAVSATMYDVAAAIDAGTPVMLPLLRVQVAGAGLGDYGYYAQIGQTVLYAQLDVIAGAAYPGDTSLLDPDRWYPAYPT